MNMLFIASVAVVAARPGEEPAAVRGRARRSNSKRQPHKMLRGRQDTCRLRAAFVIMNRT